MSPGVVEANVKHEGPHTTALGLLGSQANVGFSLICAGFTAGKGDKAGLWQGWKKLQISFLSHRSCILTLLYSYVAQLMTSAHLSFLKKK